MNAALAMIAREDTRIGGVFLVTLVTVGQTRYRVGEIRRADGELVSRGHA